MYCPDSYYLWDFWLQQRNGLFHLFHLQAPRTPDDPELRHGVATLGHAVSRDLRHWQETGTALDAGAPGAWDDRAVWTGSVLDLGGRYAMLYTGTSHAEDGKVQRVGLALSDDLERWERHQANPVILADPRWYRGQNPDHRNELAWRDPWLMRAPDGDGFVALLTAQAIAAPRHACGCIALARSADLVHWRVEPPLVAPGCYFEMEVPQLWHGRGWHYLLFSAHKRTIHPTVDQPAPRLTGTFYLASRAPFGSYWFGGVVRADDVGSEYGVRLVTDADGNVRALSWLGEGRAGEFVGALGDPRSVIFDDDGGLVVC